MHKMINLVRLFAAISALVAIYAIAIETPRLLKDKIENLPGLNYPINFRQFSGYLEAAPNRHLHYWFVESQGNPAVDPIIVWFNGGPGCSSLLGFMFENGPFRVNRDGATLWENRYAWNKLGSVLYVEGPTGVGFAYSDGDKDDVTDDIRANKDFYNALNDFFINVRPDFQNRDMFLTGESYAGVYIPSTAALIVDGMNNGEFKGRLVGLAIGNGLLSERQQHNSVVPFLYFHGLMSSDLWKELKIHCCPDHCVAECDFHKHLIPGGRGQENRPKNTTCGNLAKLVSEVLVDQTLNDPYNAYRDCYKGKLHHRQLNSTVGAWLRHAGQAALINLDSTDANGGFDCYGQSAMEGYLNRPDVQEALHIPKSFKWANCSKYVENTYGKIDREMNPWVDHIWSNSKVRMLIYNGDVDMVCNFLGDEWFMSNFTSAWKVPVREWRYSWLHRGQIAGYVKSYDRIEVATVKGSGHFVPTSRPGPMLQLLYNFMHESSNYSAPYPFDL